MMAMAAVTVVVEAAAAAVVAVADKTADVVAAVVVVATAEVVAVVAEVAWRMVLTPTAEETLEAEGEAEDAVAENSAVQPHQVDPRWNEENETHPLPHWTWATCHANSIRSRIYSSISSSSARL
jgi:hypothetical protein